MLDDLTILIPLLTYILSQLTILDWCKPQFEIFLLLRQTNSVIRDVCDDEFKRVFKHQYERNQFLIQKGQRYCIDDHHSISKRFPLNFESSLFPLIRVSVFVCHHNKYHLFLRSSLSNILSSILIQNQPGVLHAFDRFSKIFIPQSFSNNGKNIEILKLSVSFQSKSMNLYINITNLSEPFFESYHFQAENVFYFKFFRINHHLNFMLAKNKTLYQLLSKIENCGTFLPMHLDAHDAKRSLMFLHRPRPHENKTNLEIIRDIQLLEIKRNREFEYRFIDLPNVPSTHKWPCTNFVHNHHYLFFKNLMITWLFKKAKDYYWQLSVYDFNTSVWYVDHDVIIYHNNDKSPVDIKYVMYPWIFVSTVLFNLETKQKVQIFSIQPHMSSLKVIDTRFLTFVNFTTNRLEMMNLESIININLDFPY